ncbi:MAG: acyl-[ACP]--phospholipid O-acyltransferase [Planctomycetota bacterium]|jgi:acyl-[acyl-carrier-protein]-phospholipid O-acyltransferase/long-chain-fatty-acid--[acyl-carrier-protein] ligase
MKLTNATKNKTSSFKSKGFKALLVTQFLGAFNDNAFKLVISLIAVNSFADRAGEGSQYIALAGVMLVLPFILFSSYAGFLADRYSKKVIMFWVKVAEVVVMCMGALVFYFGNIYAMMIVLFLMGTQSALFSPSKYGILPEIFTDNELSKANGVIQLWTFLAMIAGTIVGGQLLDLFDNKAYIASIVFIFAAIIGVLSSRFITDVPSSDSKKSFEINFLKDIYNNIIEIKQSRPLFLCVIGYAYFWFLCALYQMNVLLYAKNMMNISDTLTGLLLASTGIGVATGSVLAGRWSEEKVEFGLVPIGAIGLGVFSLVLGISFRYYWIILADLFFMGVSCGLFVIPLTAYIQQKSPADGKGRILATNNFIAFCSILLSSAMLWLFANILKFNPALIFIVFGILSFFVIAYICKLLPEFLLRFLSYIITHTFYKIKIIGRENIPKEGGALLVCNHVSYNDGSLVLACTQRFIRFMMLREIANNKLLKPFMGIMKVIPVSATDSPKKIVGSFSRARNALLAGELVCIFAEGAISRTGNIMEFKKGFERIMKKVDVPIIPVNLDRVWGSIFSFEGGKFFRKVPSRLPYPVTVSFGKPMPPGSTAYQVRTAVADLGSEAFKYRLDKKESLPYRFYCQAIKRPFKKCVSDSSGISLTYAKAFIGSLVFSRAINRKCRNDDIVGILLPNSVAASLVNVAISILGKCPVNLNFTSSEESVTKSIHKCDIKHIYSSKKFVEKTNIKVRDEMIGVEDLRHEVKFFDRIFFLSCFIFLPKFLFRKICFKDNKEDCLATVMFSSGSTGEPKGVMLTHTNINSNIEGLYQVFHTQKDDVVMGVVPMFHSFGFTGALWYPLITGMGVVYHNNPLDFKVTGEMIEKHKATLLMATPTFLMGHIRKCTPEQFASLRYVVTGAEKLKDRIAHAFRKRFNIEPLEGYGCTELSPVVSVNVPDVTDKDMVQVGNKPGTIGRPLPGITARVVHPDTFEELQAGEDGLLLIKGPNVMLGFLGDKENTRKVMHREWYITGDIAMIDDDGFITIKDRLSRISKIGGEMVPHIKIEEEIHTRLGVSNEQICAVTSVPDERKGESLTVLYKGDVDLEKLFKEMANSELSKLWLPKQGAYHQVDEIPVLGSGKLDLKRIKVMALEKKGNKK